MVITSKSYNSIMALPFSWIIFSAIVSTVFAVTGDLEIAFAALNQARTLQNLQPLLWSPDLTAYAQFWADQMGSGLQSFQHASGKFRPDQGENLFVQQSSQCDVAYDYPFRTAMNAWLAQASLYNNQPITGHEAWLHWCKHHQTGDHAKGATEWLINVVS
ncbi:hypothetical protein VHEMI06244 [[Torrubiella] hemipterigena]|uniref:SCP domain-containing protein n=1 Tax=[Torrubiella] hemipterigena TaxID=1531966 RepID=A0A0A1TKL8_9HYPO|nr:hypothetical protein VHEMI06244 [[Torrubiella] hemipterigena]